MNPVKPRRLSRFARVMRADGLTNGGSLQAFTAFTTATKTQVIPTKDETMTHEDRPEAVKVDERRVSPRTHRHWNDATRLRVFIAGSTPRENDASRVGTGVPGPAGGPAVRCDGELTPRFLAPTRRGPSAYLADSRPHLEKCPTGAAPGAANSRSIFCCRSESNKPIAIQGAP